MNTDLFRSCGHCWVFQICWHIECSTFTASAFRIWNSSTEIPSPPLALFVVMLSKAHLTSHSRMSVNSRSWWWSGRPGVLRFMGSQRVGHDWVTQLNRIQYVTYDDLFCSFKKTQLCGSIALFYCFLFHGMDESQFTWPSTEGHISNVDCYYKVSKNIQGQIFVCFHFFGINA